MSDISISGINSKYNTRQIIEDLMEVERAPLRKMEESIVQFEETKRGWEQLKRKTSSLQTASRKLYSFENPFDERKVESSNPSVVTASATRGIEQSSVSLKVSALASGDKFRSHQLSSDYRVPAGKFSFNVGEKVVSLDYGGGTLRDFSGKLNTTGSGILRSQVVRQSGNTQTLVIESVGQGSDEKISFSNETVNWGLNVGLLKPYEENPPFEITEESSHIRPWTKPIDRNLYSFENSELALKPGVELQLDIGSYKINEGTRLVYEVMLGPPPPLPKEPLTEPTATEESEEEPVSEEQAPLEPPLPTLSIPSVEFDGIAIEGSESISQVAPLTESPPPNEEPEPPKEAPEELPQQVDRQALYFLSMQRPVALPPVADSEEFTMVDVDISQSAQTTEGLLIRNDTGRELFIRNIKIIPLGEDFDAYIPANPLSVAENAVVEIDGIEIERESNTIDDIIPGVTLNLRSVSEKPVTIDVTGDKELAKDWIIEFVYRYNQLLIDINVLAQSDPAVITELEFLNDSEREQAIEQLGLFRNDLTLNQLKRSLQAATSQAYPTSQEGLTLLANIGISTSASVEFSADRSRLRGYLEVNEELLDQSLDTSLQGVRELFGMDINEEAGIDSGAAYNLDRILAPYLQLGTGHYSAKVSRIDSQISRTESDISSYEVRLERYEASLRRKYGNMEALLNELESTSRTIDNYMQTDNNRRR